MSVATALVFTVKVALVDPVGMVILAGTLAAALSLESVTTAPPLGAGPFSVSVLTVAEVPPVTLGGLTASEERTGGSTVRDAVWAT